MSKKDSFPVKTFTLKGSSLSEAQRAAAIRQTLRKDGEAIRVVGSETMVDLKAKILNLKVALKQQQKPARGKLRIADTATGSGKVRFFVSSRCVTRDEPIGKSILNSGGSPYKSAPKKK